MSRFKTLLLVPVLALASVLVGEAPQANAGGFAISFGSGFGGGGFGHSGFGRSGFHRSGFGHSGFGHSGFHHGFNNGHRAFGPVIHSGFSSRYRAGYGGFNQPQFRYHAPALVPHRNHFHYQPGHFDRFHGRHR